MGNLTCFSFLDFRQIKKYEAKGTLFFIFRDHLMPYFDTLNWVCWIVKLPN